MLVRIVKLSISPDKTDEFLINFEQYKSRIRFFKGCNHLELLQETNHKGIFFTYSYWDAEEDLESYRTSPLFKEVWSKTKVLFNDKPMAWSLKKQVELNNDFKD